MHAPHYAPEVNTAQAESGNESEEVATFACATAGLETQNRFEALADMSPGTAESSTRRPSKKARGKVRTAPIPKSHVTY